MIVDRWGRLRGLWFLNKRRYAFQAPADGMVSVCVCCKRMQGADDHWYDGLTIPEQAIPVYSMCGHCLAEGLAWSEHAVADS